MAQQIVEQVFPFGQGFVAGKFIQHPVRVQHEVAQELELRGGQVDVDLQMQLGFGEPVCQPQ